jgi:hypothetical protein
VLSVDVTISRFRRDLVLGWVLRAALLTGALGCMLVAPLLGFHEDGAMLLALIGGTWIVLSYRSMQGTRLAAQSPMLIAAGQFEQAENRIDSALRSFSLFKTGKLLSLHHLALLRHAQKRWRESALLCEALLTQRLPRLQALTKTTLLLLADANIQLGEMRGAFNALNGLHAYRLNLNESLTLQSLQLEYGARIGAWDAMLQGLPMKVQLAELMPTVNAARSQAYLGMAALKTGRLELARWLRRRAELLATVSEIAADRSILAEVLGQSW